MVDVKVSFVEQFAQLANKLGKLSRTNQLKVSLIRAKPGIQRTLLSVWGPPRLESRGYHLVSRDKGATVSVCTIRAQDRPQKRCLFKHKL